MEYVILSKSSDKSVIFGYSEVMCNFLKFRKPLNLRINECTRYSKWEAEDKMKKLQKFWNDIPNNPYIEMYLVKV